jgi:hypothetical protein
LPGIVVLAIAAISARSVALAGFGLDSPIEIGASVAVIWELPGTGLRRQRRALRLIGSVVTGTPLPRRVQSSRPRHGSLSVSVSPSRNAHRLPGEPLVPSRREVPGPRAPGW